MEEEAKGPGPLPSFPPTFRPSFLHVPSAFTSSLLPFFLLLTFFLPPSSCSPPLSDSTLYLLPWFPVWSLLHSAFIPHPLPPLVMTPLFVPLFFIFPFWFFGSSAHILDPDSPCPSSIPPRSLAPSHLSEFPLPESFLPWSLIPWFNHTSPIPWLSPYSTTTTSPLLLHKCSLFFPLYLHHHQSASFIHFFSWYRVTGHICVTRGQNTSQTLQHKLKWQSEQLTPPTPKTPQSFW